MYAAAMRLGESHSLRVPPADARAALDDLPAPRRAP
jgi:hypothetical protein